MIKDMEYIKEKELWRKRIEKINARLHEAQDEAERCMQRFFSLDPASKEKKLAKDEWEFAVANLAKTDIEGRIESLGLAIQSLLALHTDPEDILTFITDTAEKTIICAAAKVCIDSIAVGGDGK